MHSNSVLAMHHGANIKLAQLFNKVAQLFNKHSPVIALQRPVFVKVA